MKRAHKSGGQREQGVALLIAIFVLLLISVVAIALLVSSGTETALGANYRASATVYYAALAGLEEARGRLLSKNPDYFTQAAVPSPFLPGYPVYVINQLTGETVKPWDNGNAYYDKEYAKEFIVEASASSWSSVNSVWNNNAKGIPGPAYKWVRITAATEFSLNLDVNSDRNFDHSTPIYYNPSATDSHGNPAPGLMLGSGAPGAVQVLQITALAALPNGSQKLLQYVVYPTTQTLSFPAALTFDGPNVGPGHNPFDAQLNMPYSALFIISGNDQDYYQSSGGCTFGPNPSPQPVRAIGYSNNDSSQAAITTAVANGTGYNNGDFVGNPSGTTPNIFYVGSPPPPGPPTLAANMQTLTELNGLVASISQQADLSLGSVTQSDANNLMPAAMSATNPMTVVVNGDFTESGWSGAGYGVLLVTGTFTYDPNSQWYGVILVVGKGVFQSTAGNPGYTGKIAGAVLIANTVDAHGNPLSTLGSPTFDFQGYGSTGIDYSSCWVQAAQSASKYQVLSFREIPQN